MLLNRLSNQKLPKRTKQNIKNIILPISCLLYMSISIMFFIDPGILSRFLVFYYTLYPYLFSVYMFSLRNSIKKIFKNNYLKWTGYIFLFSIFLIIIVNESVIITRIDEQSIRGIYSLYISFLMFIVILIDLYALKAIKKYIQRKTKQSKSKPSKKWFYT